MLAVDMRIKEWERLKFIDPSIVLPKLKEIQTQVVNSNLSDNIKGLRTHALKHHDEKRISAIFCYGMSAISKKKFVFAAAPKNDLDYDSIVRWHDDNSINYFPLQIKKIVPERLNLDANLNHELQKISERYKKSQDTVFLIDFNKTGEFKLSDVVIPIGLEIAQLWVMFSSRLDQSTWCIVGDFLKHPRIYEFTYPRRSI